jgi:fatty-acid peroxygenase
VTTPNPIPWANRLASRVVSGLRKRLVEDLIIRLARDRYEAVARLRETAGGADCFPVRVLGRRGLVVRGEAGVRAFYDATLVTRRAAVPAPIRLVLFGPGAVHGLHGIAHSRRKTLLLQMVDDEAAERLTIEVAERLDHEILRWEELGTVQLLEALMDVYGAAALEWAGTGTRGGEAKVISRELGLIVDGFGLGGTPYARAVLARVRAQRWAVGVIKTVRDGRREAPDGSPVAVLAATGRDQLSDEVAGTELLNLVRPTVAVAYFGAYAAHAISTRPDWQLPLAAGSVQHLRAFEHEVRRWYPFTPLLTGRIKRSYRWGLLTYRKRDWMVLDVIGTNHDPRIWERPEKFAPERFLEREPTAFDYVPHGGGDPSTGHRCPGEPLAVGILAATIERLATIEFTLGPDTHQVPLHRIPSRPVNGMTLLNVRRRIAPLTRGCLTVGG